ncbi:hypothetical protein Cylst_2618 [Cylindrospermum stagnale PCC 7417]|uniref:RRXRR domain-containing protein n=1 Tax=Cylindrospermum stagnale PCC 7417 TaxID=56107 RepID=K9WX81_9NOST|nr:RRXRR domain-containing protein [Cylindrospermum stagnale]AFZ24823.1 hypothetical protein Cylst_2618 [Cylindrospermum stagnale PCC 7417]
MTKVFLLNANQQPLYPIRISLARILLSQGKATVFRRYPFTIILKETFSHPKLGQLEFKMQPSGKTPPMIGQKLNIIDVGRFSKRGNK